METCKFIFYAFGAKSLQYFTKTDQIIKCIKEDFSQFWKLILILRFMMRVMIWFKF